jgi:L-rhamnose isomerase/sugar isomerase
MDAGKSEKIFEALDHFRIELPSWGFANTGTRFGKFIQPAAATTTEEKFSDAGQVHRLTGICPTIALHVLWDCKEGVQSPDEIKKLAHRHGVLPGSINPNLFQDQEYKYGSFGNPDAAIRQRALEHARDSIEIARRLNSRDVSMWFADGSNYPGTANIRQRKQWFTELLRESHEALAEAWHTASLARTANAGSRTNWRIHYQCRVVHSSQHSKQVRLSILHVRFRSLSLGVGSNSQYDRHRCTEARGGRASSF